MLSSYDQETAVYNLLKSSPIKAAITGGIYKGIRPTGSTKEDIVINTINVPMDVSWQVGKGNVNIHVPAITATINGVSQLQPNNERMRVLTGMAIEVLKKHYSDNYNIGIEQQTNIQDINIPGDWYSNIRFFISWTNTD